MKVNSNYEKLPGGYLFAETARRTAAYEAAHPNAEVIRLGIGDVTRPLTKTVVKAMVDATMEMSRAETFRGYSPAEGWDFLIEAIRAHDYLSRGIEISSDEIFISDGSKSDVSNIQELFSPDAVIAVTDPVYPVYVDSNAMAGRLGDYRNGRWTNLVYLPCTAENGFVPELPKGHVDVIYLCFPNNPTGTTLTKEQLKPFVDYARAEEALIVYDTAYKAFITSGAPESIYEIEGAKEVAVECCSFSKSAGFTGTRCAFTVIPKAVSGKNGRGEQQSLNAMWARRTGSKFNGVSYPVQRAAAAAYSEKGWAECMDTIHYYQENAAIIRAGLTKAGYEVYGGVDAPYLWMKTPLNSWEFFDRLLARAEVVGTPGAGFGPSGEGYFRLTAFNSHEKTREAVQRITERM